MHFLSCLVLWYMTPSSVLRRRSAPFCSPGVPKDAAALFQGLQSPQERQWRLGPVSEELTPGAHCRGTKMVEIEKEVSIKKQGRKNCNRDIKI